MVNSLEQSEYLPAMSIPDVEGVRDDVEYAVQNLDMSGFKLHKEDVSVELWRQSSEFCLCFSVKLTISCLTSNLRFCR